MKKSRIIAAVLAAALLTGCSDGKIGIFAPDNSDYGKSSTSSRSSKTENSGSKTEYNSSSSSVIVKPVEENFRIVKDKSKNVKFEKFDNGLVSMDIPQGWKFTAYPGSDAVRYTFIVRDPSNPDFQIYFNMKGEGYLASEKERQWYATYYPGSVFAVLPAINPQNTEGVFRVFSQAVAAAGGAVVGDFVYPTINDFTVVDKLGNVPIGGDIVRASYHNEFGENVEGVFTSTPAVINMYYVNAVNVYNTMFFTAPEGELLNWIDILNHCVSSITFSDEFVKAFYAEEQALAQTSAEIARINSQTSSIITDGWNNRQSTYDIISQKQSDATLGYERVYDTETNEIYKAFNGFTDSYTGERFKAVSDNMYLSGIDGYIER